MNLICKVIAILGTATIFGGLYVTTYAQSVSNASMSIAQITAEDFYKRGVGKADRGDFKGAIQDFTEAIRLNPNSVEAYYDRAIARSEIGDKQGETEDLEAVLEIPTNDIKTYYYRGQASIDLEDEDHQEYTEAVRIQPRNAEEYYFRAYFHIQEGNTEAAIADYTQAIQLKPNYVEAYYDRGHLRLSELQDKQGAIADFSQVIRIKPKDAFAYSSRANLRFYLRDKQGAIADYTQFIRILPGNALASRTQAQLSSEDYEIHPLLCSQAYQNRAQLRSETGDKQGAKVAKRLRSPLALPQASMVVEHTAEGIADYTQAIQTDPNPSSFLAYFNRGELRFELRDYQGAIADYTEVIRTRPDFATAYTKRGNARTILGDKQEAAKDFQQAASLSRNQNTESNRAVQYLVK